MAVGTTLVQLRKMLNAEIEDEIDETISNAGITRKNQLLNNMQQFLWNQHDYLRGKVRVEAPIPADTQYCDLPTGIDLDHLDKPTYVLMNNWRYEVQFGIKVTDYNVFNSSLGVKSQPIYKFDFVNVDGTLMMEVWPISTVDQTLELSGILPLTQMVSDSDTCVVDDMAIVLFVAAEILAKRGAGDAQAKLAKATAYINSLRSGKPSRYETFNIAGNDWLRRDNDNFKRPVVAVGGGDSGGGGSSGGPSIGIG